MPAVNPLWGLCMIYGPCKIRIQGNRFCKARTQVGRGMGLNYRLGYVSDCRLRGCKLRLPAQAAFTVILTSVYSKDSRHFKDKRLPAMRADIYPRIPTRSFI